MRHSVPALLLWLALSAAARADPPMALDHLARDFWEAAVAAEQRGSLDRAAANYEAVLRRRADFTAALLALGRVRESQERWQQAEEVYLRLPADADAVEALGLLFLGQGRMQEAADVFQGLERMRQPYPGARRLRALALARIDPDEATVELDLYLHASRREGDALLVPEAVEAAMAVHGALLDADRPLDAARVLDELAAAFAHSPADQVAASEAVADVAHMDDMRRHALALSSVRVRRLPVGARPDLARARADVEAGHPELAATALQALVEQAALDPEVQALRSVVAEQTGDIPTAVAAVRRAEWLQPLEAAHPHRLGALYARYYTGRLDELAIEAWSRTLRLDPARAELWLDKARLELRQGDAEEWRDAAAASLLRYEALIPEHARDAFVHEARRGLELPEPSGADPPEWASRCAEAHGGAACEAYYLGLALFTYGDGARNDGSSDWDLAEQHVERSRELAPSWVLPLNLTAMMALRRAKEHGDGSQRQRARRAYESSLAIEPEQGHVLSALGAMLEADGDEEGALALWRRGAALDRSAEAHYHLALYAERQGEAQRAIEHLNAYLGGSDTGYHREAAMAMADRLERARATRSALLLGGAGVGALCLVGLPLWVVGRRRGGVDIDGLLERVPTAYRDVTRTVSAIRHEVLKHNTTVLDEVADALERGDPGPSMWAAENLFGSRGALARLHEHQHTLEQLALRHNLRLNLRHKDPIFAPMGVAVAELERCQSAMERGQASIAPTLRKVSEALNRTAYRGLGRLLRRLCVLDLSDELLDGVWEGVSAEPDVRAAGVPELTLSMPERPIALRIFRGELEDVLANLLRNAASASAAHGADRLGLRIELEDDWVTGIERVAIRMCDDAPVTISTAMIRSRYIERGLGLTVDLISRHGGSIHVEDEPGWAKAVVVRFDVAEQPAGEAT